METKLAQWNSHFEHTYKMLIVCNLNSFAERIEFYRKVGVNEISNYGSISKRTYDEIERLLNEINWAGVELADTDNAKAYIVYYLVGYILDFLDVFYFGYPKYF